MGSLVSFRAIDGIPCSLSLGLSYPATAFDLDFYTEVHDLSYLFERLNEDAFGKKYRKLNEALCELVKEYSLVGFHTLSIENTESVLNLARVIDKANGYIYGGLDPGVEANLSSASGLI